MQINLTHQEAAALSIACLQCGETEHRSEALEEAREKIRDALNGVKHSLDDDLVRAVIAHSD